MVCNPYWGKIRWIKTTDYQSLERFSYALGYDESSKSHKILSFYIYYSSVKFKIYDFNSDSWRVLDITRDWIIYSYDCNRGVSLKGNTYWLANKRYLKPPSPGDKHFLLCFDFTRERFGSPLPLPFEWHTDYSLAPLSSVRDEQLAVLLQRWGTNRMEIWVTTKIEPNSVSWSSKFFLSVNMGELTRSMFWFEPASFFIDEEKKFAVVFGKDKMKKMHNRAYIIGEDGSFKESYIGGSQNNNLHSLVCSSSVKF